MIELVLLSLLLLYVLSIACVVARFRPPGMRTGTARPRATPEAVRGESIRLRLAHTERPGASTAAFVGRFGIDIRTLRDLRFYARSGDLASFPPPLVALLRALHEGGGVNGAETVDLLFHGRPLRDGEAVYFALIDVPPEPRLVAFIDRRRE